MSRDLIKQSLLLAVTLLMALPATAGSIPAFCSEYNIPPATCEAEQATPCTGDCPENGKNSFDRWQDYWSKCEATQARKPGFAKDQFICSSKAKSVKSHFYMPVERWICCVKDPSVTAAKADGAPVPIKPKK